MLLMNTALIPECFSSKKEKQIVSGKDGIWPGALARTSAHADSGYGRRLISEFSFTLIENSDVCYLL